MHSVILEMNRKESELNVMVKVLIYCVSHTVVLVQLIQIIAWWGIVFIQVVIQASNKMWEVCSC